MFERWRCGDSSLAAIWSFYCSSMCFICICFFFSPILLMILFVPKKKILFSLLFASKSNYYHHHHHGSTLRLLPAPSMMIIIIFIYSYHYHIIIIRSINHWRFHFFFIWNHLNDKSLEIRLKFQWKVTVNIISVDSNKTTAIQHLSFEYENHVRSNCPFPFHFISDPFDVGHCKHAQNRLSIVMNMTDQRNGDFSSTCIVVVVAPFCRIPALSSTHTQ